MKPRLLLRRYFVEVVRIEPSFTACAIPKAPFLTKLTIEEWYYAMKRASSPALELALFE